MTHASLGALAAFAVGAMVGCTASASAAELPYKAPAEAVIAPYTWTGFYVGGTVGWAQTAASVSMSTVNGPNPLYFPADIPGLNAIGSPSFSLMHPVVGAKAGYNAQWNHWVLGLEGDISLFAFQPSAVTTGHPFAACLAFCFATFSTAVQTSWLATVRPRIGYAIDHLLFYGTGGAAFANLKYFNAYTAFSPNGAGLDFETASASQTRVGWSAGGGIDCAFTPHFILSAEYLHVDLGSVTATGLATTQFNPNTATFTFLTTLRSDIVRVGAAYKF